MKAASWFAPAMTNRDGRENNEQVSIGAKHRNSYHYADAGVDWVVGVNPDKNKLYFYPHEVFSKYPTRINVKQVPSVEFPINNDICERMVY